MSSRELGPVTTASKLTLYAEAYFPDGAPRFRDLLDTYVLLGDPATRIGLPTPDIGISVIRTRRASRAGRQRDL